MYICYALKGILCDRLSQTVVYQDLFSEVLNILTETIAVRAQIASKSMF